jgi:uncharacterized protein YoxC
MTERLVCTIITKSYLAHARTLAATLAAHHSDLKLYVLLADRVDGYFDPTDEPFEIIQLEDLPDQNTIHQLCFYYTPFELCCALRGALHDYIFHHTSAESWLFLDADIMVCHSLDSIFEQLSTVSILLTPHCQTPVSLQDVNPHELNLLRAGLSNAGFLGLRRTEETQRFIAWFKERLTHYCFNDQALGEPRGLFVDQLWLNLVLLYFQEVAFLKEPGANIGHWNLYEKQLTISEENTITIAERPLLFVHFSGWDIESPTVISKYSLMYENYDNSAWSRLAKTYQQQLLEHGYETVIQYPYAFDRFNTGELISINSRRTYYEELIQGTTLETSPFESFSYFERKPYRIRSINHLQATLTQTQSELAEVHTELQKTQAYTHQLYGDFTQTKYELQNTQVALATAEQQVQRSQAEITHLSQEIARLSQENTRLSQFIAVVKASKFWQFRNFWWGLKQRFGQSEIEHID